MSYNNNENTESSTGKGKILWQTELTLNRHFVFGLHTTIRRKTRTETISHRSHTDSQPASQLRVCVYTIFCFFATVSSTSFSLLDVRFVISHCATLHNYCLYGLRGCKHVVVNLHAIVTRCFSVFPGVVEGKGGNGLFFLYLVFPSISWKVSDQLPSYLMILQNWFHDTD